MVLLGLAKPKINHTNTSVDHNPTLYQVHSLEKSEEKNISWPGLANNLINKYLQEVEARTNWHLDQE